MSRKRADLIEVRGAVAPGAAGPTAALPTHFLWRDRVYAVREVLGHWKESGAWWEEARRAVAASTARLGDPTEREVWRVEASPGRCFAPGVYDLSFDRFAGRWTLTSTTD